ncbi:hypothetical protein T459_23386 [Capsicum annuum]|uniref:Major facilitator superfamily (MFS) profile domain-containing protein n=1 Tax=Capsicum annuum TaxID=4072 RepID=A0A2G2YSJ3_CAPAN|nr:hypothetical protein T459_23386 [Capsicum annuum]
MWLQETIVSMVVVGAIFGVAIGGCLNDTFERKLLILIVDVLFFPGALIMSITLVSWVIIIGRIFVSLGVGMDSMTAPFYISEASPHKIISALVSMNDLLITGGQFLSYLINLAFTDVKGMWRWILGIAGLPTVIQFGIMIVLLESPKWLYRKAVGREGGPRNIVVKVSISKVCPSVLLIGRGKIFKLYGGGPFVVSEKIKPEGPDSFIIKEEIVEVFKRVVTHMTRISGVNTSVRQGFPGGEGVGVREGPLDNVTEWRMVGNPSIPPDIHSLPIMHRPQDGIFAEVPAPQDVPPNFSGKAGGYSDVIMMPGESRRGYIDDIMMLVKSEEYIGDMMMPDNFEGYIDDIMMPGKFEGHIDRMMMPDICGEDINDVTIPDRQQVRYPNTEDKDLEDEELLNPGNPRRAEQIAAHVWRNINRNRLFREKRVYQPVQYNLNDDDDGMDREGATGTIIPLPLAPGEIFNITSTMIQLLNLKGLFGGLLGDDPNLHLVNFVTICKFFDNPGVGQNAIWQLPTEALHETWERFKKKLTQCPNPNMMDIHLMETLSRVLNSVTKPIIDNAAGSSFVDLTFPEASEMLDRMTKQS